MAMSLCGLAGSLTVHRTTSFGPLAARKRPLGENATALTWGCPVRAARCLGRLALLTSHSCACSPLVARRRPSGENATACGPLNRSGFLVIVARCFLVLSPLPRTDALRSHRCTLSSLQIG